MPSERPYAVRHSPRHTHLEDHWSPTTTVYPPGTHPGPCTLDPPDTTVPARYNCTHPALCFRAQSSDSTRDCAVSLGVFAPDSQFCHRDRTGARFLFRVQQVTCARCGVCVVAHGHGTPCLYSPRGPRRLKPNKGKITWRRPCDRWAQSGRNMGNMGACCMLSHWDMNV